jgi:acetyl-CoA synthetase
MSEEISSLLKENRVFPPSDEASRRARVSSEQQYEELYRRSIDDPISFWAEQAEKELEWNKKWDSVLDYDLSRLGTSTEPYVSWFKGGSLNVSHNCLDRHLETRGDKPAIIWQAEDPNNSRTFTFRELHREVCIFANVLKKHGIKKGDLVSVYMPMIPQLPIACLALARIGAIHSVVFSAFSADALKSRIQDGQSCAVITADTGVHAGKIDRLKDKVDLALNECPSVKHVFVYKRSEETVSMKEGRDFWWTQEAQAFDISADCPAEPVDAEHPLFTLYTSGSTGKPKGVMHTSAGYLLYTHMTCKYVFDMQEDDVFWCTADVGWITGHSYLVYGPLSNGVTNVMFEGVPTYPEPNRFWQIIEQHKVNIFYTAPTALRALMRLGDSWPEGCDLSSLRLLGSVGEPINPEAWMWYHKVIGKEKCPIVDTWWQTETAGVMLTTLPGALSTKPGSAGKPFFGVVPEILNSDGTATKEGEGGCLCISKPWPGMIRGVYGDEKGELIKQVYFSRFDGKYFSGDGCRKDEDNYYWLLGRIDDVINVSAHRFATAEIESALVSHKSVAEAAVVGFPHETKGQGIYCYVTLHGDLEGDNPLAGELISHVRNEISPIAKPDRIHFTPALPKTRSGKIMRRILRKIAEGDTANLGDTSTLADPSVVERLLKGRVSGA